MVFTARTFAELQKEAKESLEFQEGLLEDGVDVPQWLKDGDYEFVYNYQDIFTLLRAYEPYISLAAISRASGINQGQLSHYANGLKKPRLEQRKRIFAYYRLFSTNDAYLCEKISAYINAKVLQ